MRELHCVPLVPRQVVHGHLDVVEGRVRRGQAAQLCQGAAARWLATAHVVGVLVGTAPPRRRPRAHATTAAAGFTATATVVVTVAIATGVVVAAMARAALVTAIIVGVFHRQHIEELGVVFQVCALRPRPRGRPRRVVVAAGRAPALHPHTVAHDLGRGGNAGARRQPAQHLRAM